MNAPRYLVLAVGNAVIATLTFLLGQPMISITVLLAGTMAGVAVFLHEYPSSPANAPPA